MLPETASSLLVHLGPRGDSVDCHEEDLSRLNHPEENLDVVKNVFHDFLFGYSEKKIKLETQVNHRNKSNLSHSNNIVPSNCVSFEVIYSKLWAMQDC